MWKGRDKSEKLGATQLEVLPPRPKLRTEPCQIVFNSLKTIRLTWTWNWNWNHALIEKFEIFASVQRVKMAFATKWVKIGEIQVGQKSRKVEEVRRSNMKLAVSRRIAGFAPGFRYQIVVRGVDVSGREGPYSVPVSVQV